MVLYNCERCNKQFTQKNDLRRHQNRKSLCEGEFGVDGFFIGVPTVIGSGGIEKIIEFNLTDEEKGALDNTLNAVKKTVSETKL